MSRLQVMRYIVLPQAAMRVLPALASTWVSLFKDTSLVSTIAVADLSYRRPETSRRDLSDHRGADRDGGPLLAHGLSAGQARRLAASALQGRRMTMSVTRSADRASLASATARRRSLCSTRAGQALWHSAGAGRRQLQVNRGEVVCLIGPSGSGKSTLAALRECAWRPIDSGRIIFEGVDVASRRRAMSASCASAWAWCSRTSSCFPI